MKKQIYTIILFFGLYLGLHNGFLALYRQSEPEPAWVFPYRAALYPKIDRQALHEGIPVESEQMLQQLLADLMS